MATSKVEVPALVTDHLKEFLSDANADSELQVLQHFNWCVQLYQLNNYKTIWTDSGLLNSNAKQLLAFIDSTHQLGLLPADYHATEIHNNDSLIIKNYSAGVNVHEAALNELLLSDAFFLLANHLRYGSTTPQQFGINLPAKTADSSNLISILNVCLRENKVVSFLNSRQPQSKNYLQLTQALQQYQITHANISWDTLPARDAAHPEIFFAALQQRLLKEQWIDSSVKAQDTLALKSAVKKFQKQYNLYPDGVVGNRTKDALNKTPQYRMQQLCMNIERCKWDEDSLPMRRVFVNLPSFTCEVMDSDSVVIASRIICGKPATPSPLLNAVINYFIIYPYWTVPYSIATKEILPKLKKDTTYLSKHNMQVMNSNNEVLVASKINWKKYSLTYFPFKIRQLFGDDNTLGIVKFMFNNVFGIYLHDTDGRSLFAKEYRALSHGCIRLKEAVPLSYYLVKDDTLKYHSDTIKAMYARKQKEQVNLKYPIPIYIRYYTAQQKNNQLFFYEDIYGIDAMMINYIYKKQQPVLPADALQNAP